MFGTGVEPKTENASLMVHLYLRLVPAQSYQLSISDLEEYLRADISAMAPSPTPAEK